MPESQGRTPEASWITAAIQDPRMGMGRNLNGFHSGYDSIWVILDRLTKVAHFILVKTYSGSTLAMLYMSWILCLHGVPKKIVSDKGS
jgi:hypothetical protein